MTLLRYTLFLDDLRDPTWDLEALTPELEVEIARTVPEAKWFIETFGLPSTISFDHDLGKDEDTAMVFMHWLVEQHLDSHLDLCSIERIIIHSANPVGANNLAGLWDGFAKHIGAEVRAELKPRN